MKFILISASILSFIFPSISFADSTYRADLQVIEDKFNTKVDSIKLEIEKVKQEVKQESAYIKDLSVSWQTASSSNRIGAILLLIGLLLEIVGATLLAGNYLISKQHDLVTLKSTPPLRDLALNDTNLEGKLNFIGLVGAIFLFLGFLLQYSGTVVIISFTIILSTILILLGLSIGTLLFYIFMGQDTEQSRKEKFQILTRNLKRFVSNIFLLRIPTCDYCASILNLKDKSVVVAWVEKENSKEHPFLYQPSEWHIGHEFCLKKSGWYQTYDIGKEMNLKQCPPTDFVKNEIDRIEKWYVGFHEYWTNRRNKQSTKTSNEAAFLRITKLLKKK